MEYDVCVVDHRDGPTRCVTQDLGGVSLYPTTRILVPLVYDLLFIKD